jgi:hypothetical protein
VFRSPSLHPRDILRAAKVVLVLRFGGPGATTRRLTGLPTIRFGAVLLVARVARICCEEFSAKQTVVPSLVCHGSPSLRRIVQRKDIRHGATASNLGKGKSEERRRAKSEEEEPGNPSDESRRRRSTKKIHDFQIASINGLSECR